MCFTTPQRHRGHGDDHPRPVDPPQPGARHQKRVPAKPKQSINPSIAGPQFTTEDEKSIHDIRKETICELTFEIYPDPQQIEALSSLPSSQWTPELREGRRKMREYVQGWGHPETEELQLFINTLRRKGVTEGQLNYQDYTSAQFNLNTPTKFRIRRNVLNILKLEELFTQKASQATHELGFRIIPRGEASNNAQVAHPTSGEIQLYNNELHTEDTIGNENLKLFHWGCECHCLGDTDNFEIDRDPQLDL